MIYLIMCWNDCNLIHILAYMHVTFITFIIKYFLKLNAYKLGCEFKCVQTLSVTFFYFICVYTQSAARRYVCYRPQHLLNHSIVSEARV